MSAISWQYSGCVALQNNAPPPPLSPITGSTSVVDSCVGICATQNFTYALLSNVSCGCITAQQHQRSLFAVNSAECNVICDRQLPCGGDFQRFSAYNTGIDNVNRTTTLVPSAPTIPSPTNTMDPTNGVTDRNTITSGQVSGPSSRNIATIVASSISALIVILCLSAFVIHRYRKKRSLHHLPRLEVAVASTDTSKESSANLARSISKRSQKSSKSVSASSIQGIALTSKNGLSAVLPRTPNMIYSVVTGHDPQADDEVRLKQDDVVAVQKHYNDGWGIGMNVSSGEAGVFPLGCLVSEDEWAKKGFQVPSRTESLGCEPSSDMGGK